MSALKMLAIETSGTTASIALGFDGDVVERTIAEPREQTAQILGLIDELLAGAGSRLTDLDALVFGRGPGSFTGLRVAAAVVQGLSLASGVPIVAVSSLAALAQRGFGGRAQAGAAAPAPVGSPAPGRAAHSGSLSGAAAPAGVASDAAGDPSGVWAVPGRALCCTDARMGEVYWAGFRQVGGLAVPDTGERIGRPGSVVAPDGRFLAFGDGFGAHRQALAGVIERAAGVVAALQPGAPELLALAAADAAAGRFVPLTAAVPVYLREADAWRRQPQPGNSAD